MSRTASKKWIWSLTGAAALVASLSLADVIVLDPAVITGQVSVSGETITSYHMYAFSSSGLSAQQTFQPGNYSLTVENGHSYRSQILVNLQHTGVNYSRLQVQRNTAVAVDADVGPTVIDFLYSTRRINATINVTGGTVRGYALYGSASQNPEYYYADTYKSPNTSIGSSVTDWIAMVPHGNVQVYGTAYVTTASGTALEISLSSQTVDVSNNPANVSWSLDLTATGTLTGVASIGPAEKLSSRTVLYYGVSGTPTQGINGNAAVSSNGLFSLQLFPGAYDVFVRSYFQNPYYMLDTQTQRITITANQTLNQNLSRGTGVIRNELDIGGVFDLSDVTQGEVYLYGADRSQTFPSYAIDIATQGVFDVLATPGTWELSTQRIYLNDASDPVLPLSGYYQRSYSRNQYTPTATVTAGQETTLALPEFFLGEANVYLDVAENGGPQVNLRNPQVHLQRNEYDASNTYIGSKQGVFHGSSTLTPLAGLRIAVEPGTYQVYAYANVNGTQTQFPAGGDLTVYTPQPTAPGPAQPVTLVDDDELTVELEFDNVTGGGYSTVTESGLGPHPPDGFQATCPANIAGCAPRFYDIKTTATFAGEVEVCITAHYTGANNIDRLLKLFHYDAASGQWEQISTARGTKIDDGDGNPNTFFVKLCGLTDSFSPFAVFQESFTFRNTHQGPDGDIQTWTVPATGRYRILATGAQGGHASTGTAVGGCGASLGGEFNLQEGDVLDILVGQKGGVAEYSGGGGGGSFVVRDGVPLIVVGGGGGVRADATQNGRPGSPQAPGVAGSLSANYTSYFIAGGSTGQGGNSSEFWGSGGGGFYSCGASDIEFGEGGSAYYNGGAGGIGYGFCGEPAHGGFGGGGSGDGCDGGGGGGGYSGGGSGWVAGGGGSYNAGLNPTSKQGGFCTPTGHGQVVIDLIGN